MESSVQPVVTAKTATAGVDPLTSRVDYVEGTLLICEGAGHIVAGVVNKVVSVASLALAVVAGGVLVATVAGKEFEANGWHSSSQAGAGACVAVLAGSLPAYYVCKRLSTALFHMGGQDFSLAGRRFGTVIKAD